MTAKSAIAHYDTLNKDLTALQQRHDSLVQQRDALAAKDVSVVQDDEMPTGDWEWQLDMKNLELERQAAKDAELDALDQQIILAQAAVEQQQDRISAYQPRYNEAQSDIKSAQSMVGAAAMQSVWRSNPNLDLSTPEGQQALADATAQERGLMDAIDLVQSIGSEYKATEWMPYTVFQTAAESGADKKTIEAMAQGIIAEDTKNLENINQAKARAKEAGISISGYEGNLNRETAKNEREIQEAKDYLIQTESDFAASAEKGAEAVRNDKSHKYSDLTKAILDPGSARTTVMGQEMSYVKFVAAMTQEEKDTYAYYLDKYDESAAVDYFERLTDPSYGILQTRVSGNMQEAVADFAEKYPALALGVSTIASPLTVAGAGYTLYSLIAGKEINPYNEWYSSNIGLGTMEEVSKKAILDSTGLEEGSGIRTLLSWGLNGVTEAVKSGENALLMGPLVSGINNPIFREAIAASTMALQSAGSTARDVKIRKGSDTQAAILAAVDFATNVATEAMTYGNMEEAFGKGASEVKAAAKKSILKNPFIEEPIGEVLGNAIGYVSDDLTMGALSERQQQITEYEKTMSHAEAVKKADQDFMKGLVETAITTALSTGVSQGVSYAAGRLAVDNTTQPTYEGQMRAKALMNGLPLDHATNDMTARILTMLTSSVTANKASQVQAVSAALYPVNGDAQGQQAAISAGLRLADRVGAEQAVAVVQDIVLETAYEGANLDTVKSAVTVAALGQGEASAVLDKINRNGMEYGDLDALIDAAGRDAQNAKVTDRIKSVMQNDRIAMRERDLIGDGALNGVKPYEKAYTQAVEQEAQARQDLETEQERAQTMGENLKTVQGQHAADPANQAVRGAVQQATKEMVGQIKVVDEYTQRVENQQKSKAEAEKALEQVRQEAMTKVREQAMADVQAQEQAEAEARAKAEKKIKEQYPNVRGELSVMKGKPTLKTDGYVILPDSAGGFFVKFSQPDEEAAQRLQAMGMEYDDLADVWFGSDDLVKIQDAIDNVNNQNDESIDSAAQTPYTETNEVNANAVQPGSVDQGQGTNAGQLPVTFGRDDGRGNSVYAGQGTGRELDNIRNGTDQVNGQGNGGGQTGLRVLTPESHESMRNNGVTDLPLNRETDQQRFSSALAEGRASNANGVYVV